MGKINKTFRVASYASLLLIVLFFVFNNVLSFKYDHLNGEKIYEVENNVNNPATLLADKSVFDNQENLKLVPSKTSTVYYAKKDKYQFNLHPYVTYFDGKFWALWSAGRVDEDSPSQIIRYSTSLDSRTWSESSVLANDPDGPDLPGRWVARGIFILDNKLVALGAYIETENWGNLRLVRFENNGEIWEQKGVFVDGYMNNYPPSRLGNSLFMTCRDENRCIYTAISNDDGASWELTRLNVKYPGDKLSEPSWYLDNNGIVHMIFRDQRKSHLLYRALSKNMGINWTIPVQTNYPDETSKNFTGILSNGWFYLINNPNPKGRDILCISFSRDGWVFDNPMVLRKGAPAMRFSGKNKSITRFRGFQYPHAFEHENSLYVIYSTNKEDIEISEFKISNFGLATFQKD